MQTRFKLLFTSHLLMSHWQKQVTGPSVNGRKFKEIVTPFFQIYYSLYMPLKSLMSLWH